MNVRRMAKMNAWMNIYLYPQLTVSLPMKRVHSPVSGLPTIGNFVNMFWKCTVCTRSSGPFYILTYYINSVTTSCTHSTICPRSLDPIYIVTYYINWVKTSWTYCIFKLARYIYFHFRKPKGKNGEKEGKIICDLCFPISLLNTK